MQGFYGSAGNPANGRNALDEQSSKGWAPRVALVVAKRDNQDRGLR